MHDKAFIDTNIFLYAFCDKDMDKQCTVLYTEDLQHNHLIDNQLEIINPFQSLNNE